MPLGNNKRLFWAVQAVGFAPDGSNTYTAAKGVQSLGVTTTFNLTEIFEIGQLSIYDNVEDSPDVEVTIEKVIDGAPLIYHLATPGATSPTLVGRSTRKASMALSLFGDTQSSASGTPNSQMTCSGLYVSSLNYNFPVTENGTESVTLVGNHKVWSSGSFTFTGGFNNTDVAPSGVMRQQHVKMGIGATGSVFPKGANGIPGINASGWNPPVADGFAARIQSISIAADLGREALNQLGKKNPFFRYVNFPVEVTCDIEVLSGDGDFINVTEDGVNTSNQIIDIRTDFGDRFNLGNKNRLSNTQFSVSTDGSNNIDTYSFVNFNDLTITSLSDPAGLTQ
jgi:hypothetical protein